MSEEAQKVEEPQRKFNMASVARTVFDELATGYDTMRKSKVRRAEERLIYRFMRAKYRGLKTLDLGCGTACYAEKVDPKMYLGIDVSQEMLKIGADKIQKLQIQRCQLKRGNMVDLNMLKEREKWPLVVSMFGSVGYTDAVEEVADEIHRYLRKGGRFFLMLPGRNFEKQGRTDSCKITPFSHQMARTIFGEQAGLQVLRTWGINIYGDKAAKYLSPFFLRLYLCIEMAIFRGSNKFQHIIVEGKKLLPEEEKKEEMEKTKQTVKHETFQEMNKQAAEHLKLNKNKGTRKLKKVGHD